jgi:hypothetical protein
MLGVMGSTLSCCLGDLTTEEQPVIAMTVEVDDAVARWQGLITDATVASRQVATGRNL